MLLFLQHSSAFLLICSGCRTL
ncbi:MAG TPA: hypothetical protein DIW43_15015 [Spongiibacteraceae bacterium]|nr:hypothetical protein [Spongiibacteraceae bacterium]